MSLCERNIDCLNCASRGMCNSYALFKYKQGRADAIEKFNNKVDYLKEHYTDACNMCTKMECDVCAINSIIEDLEQLKEQESN